MAEDVTERARTLANLGSPETNEPATANEATVVCIGCGARWILGREQSALTCDECGKRSLRVLGTGVRR